MSPFATLLRCHRLAAGLSQNRLARRAGIDPAYVNRLEARRQVPPSRSVVIRLAETLQLDAGATDRLLFAADLAPTRDWQTRAETAEVVLETMRDAIGLHDEAALVRRSA